MNKAQWCIDKHKSTNHQYDLYLPYCFHLRMVANVAEDWKHLLDDSINLSKKKGNRNVITLRNACLIAVWGHDLIEDTRTSFNEVKMELGVEAAEIIYAVTNEKGKDRKERANDKYYEGIRNTPGAIFVKLCDRIANVQYSKLTKSTMFDKYREENENFIQQLNYYVSEEYHPMFNYLINLFNEKSL